MTHKEKKEHENHSPEEIKKEALAKKTSSVRLQIQFNSQQPVQRALNEGRW